MKRQSDHLRFVDMYKRGRDGNTIRFNRKNKRGMIFISKAVRGISEGEMDGIKNNVGKYPYYYVPLGGFMPFPPETCLKTVTIGNDQGIMKWVDLVNCERCQGLKECQRHKEYTNDHMAEYKTEMERLAQIRKERMS